MTKVCDFLQLDLVVLDQIGYLLPAKDLQHLSMVNQTFMNHFRNERFWQRLLNQNLWSCYRFPTCEEEFKYLYNNAPTKLVSTTNFNGKVVRFATYSNSGSLLAAFGNGCRLWVFRGDEEIFHVYLSERRLWDKILTVSFSPDSRHLLVTGSINPFLAGNNGRETLIYNITENHVTLKSYVVLDHQMLSSWYDNDNIMFMKNYGVRDRMRLFLCSVDSQADILLYPVLTFNKRVTKIYVAKQVSPRARKIVQIANEAAESHMTLTDKLIEIGLSLGVDVNDMSALRSILDQNPECMECYRQHAHRDDQQRACNCACHRNTDKLLIFHGNDDKVYVKVMTNEALDIAKDAFLNSGDTNNPHPHENRLFSPLQVVTDFDTEDLCFDIKCSLLNNSACLSPDHKYLYITGTKKIVEPPRAPFLVIKPTCIDLETMTIRKTPDFDAKEHVVYDYNSCISANRKFLAIFTNNQVTIWSTIQQGKHIKTITDFEGMLSSVAMHPQLNRLIVTNERHVHIFESPKM